MDWCGILHLGLRRSDFDHIASLGFLQLPSPNLVHFLVAASLLLQITVSYVTRPIYHNDRIAVDGSSSGFTTALWYIILSSHFRSPVYHTWHLVITLHTHRLDVTDILVEVGQA